MMRSLEIALLAVCANGATARLGAQVRFSQPATLTQDIGTTRVTIVYNRPNTRGRKLFGALVPWGKVWCPGADEATNISFTKDVMVAGQPLAAGKYSVWAIPDSVEWTLIFSKAANVFHIPYPGAAQDALRIKLKPEPGPFFETLAFYFPEAAADHAVLHLHWGETIVAIPIGTK
jgi:Protein of unknown function (DUF2911)